MAEECLICKAPLVYLQSGEAMECALCHKKVLSKACCEAGHFVCDACHMEGLDAIYGVCLSAASKNPYEIFSMLADLPFCHMHGPEHHSMVGAALLSAYRNAGGELDLPAALREMLARGKTVPGGICGFWGCCGAAVSTGICVSVLTGATPLTKESWGLANEMTSRALARIAKAGGPRCCKRNASLAMLEAVDFFRERFGVHMERPEIVCTRAAQNAQCLGARCPFHAGCA